MYTCHGSMAVRDISGRIFYLYSSPQAFSTVEEMGNCSMSTAGCSSRSDLRSDLREDADLCE